MATDWDAVIVGGGHNGLVAACYMAKAGLKVAVLERREVVGGASVTEETFPGFRISTAAMVGGLLKPKIAADLELHKFGYGPLVPYDPVALQLYPDNRYMLWWSDPVKTLDEFAKFSRKDGEAFLDLRKRMDRLAAVLKPLELRPPLSVEEIARRFPDPEDAYFFQEVLVSPMKDFLDARFETDEAKASICSNGLVGLAAGPYSPGSVYMMLHYWPELGIPIGAVPGGMGGITAALASCARSHGAEVRTEAEVARVIVREERAAGVELLNGEVLNARVVLSNADPKRSLLGLLEPDHLEESFRRRVSSVRSEGIVFKINLALSELPDFTAIPGKELGPQHIGPFKICPSVDYLERAWDDAKFGKTSREPYMYCVIHSATDSTIVPEGKHSMGVFVQYAPYHLRDTDWETERDIFGKRCIDTLAQYAPNIPDAIIDYQFLSPKDLEEKLYLTHGHMFHTGNALAQLFNARPIRGMSDYRTPVSGYYLCGAGTHPGGTVRGAPGHNAAHEAIRDLREGVVG